MIRNHKPLPALKDLSAHNAAKSRDSVAFEDSTESVTWGEFEERSLLAADVLHRYVSKGDRVGFYCEPSVRHAAAFVGALKTGAVTTNFHVRTAPDAFRHAVETASPRVVVVDEGLADSFAENLTDDLLETISAVFVVGTATRDYEQSWDDALDTAEPETPDVLVDEDDIAIIGWTSGSTGRPKGLCHTNRTMYLKGMELATRSGFSRAEKKLVVNKPSFLIWSSFLTRALLGCESTYYMSEWSPEGWLETVEAKGITQTTLVPTMWRAILEASPDGYDLSSLTGIGSTGEKLSPATLARLRDEICETISQSYGSTEIHSTVLFNNELTDERIESVGKPQSGTEVRIVEPGGPLDEELPPNEAGEIVVNSPDAPVWAWENSAVIERSFEDGWWRSGDLGYKDEEGFLYIEGRVDFQIKSKGVKIVPEPIEEAITEHPDVANAVVVGVADEEYGQRVTAIVTPASDALTEDDLREWVLNHDKVARHERPRAYKFVSAIDRTPSGKLDRQRTKQRLELE